MTTPKPAVKFAKIAQKEGEKMRQLPLSLLFEEERVRLISPADILDWVTDGLSRSIPFKLFDDVGMVYEIQLAKLEFSSFRKDLEAFVRRAAYFEEVGGRKTWHFYISRVEGKGQIGHSNQYTTHWFYPYKGKFHGQMVKALINFMQAKGEDVVLDPFLGSGTTLIETALVGTKGIGAEINPALCLVSHIKHRALFIDFPSFWGEVRKLPIQRLFKEFKRPLEKPKRLELPPMPSLSEAIVEAVWEQFFPGFLPDLLVEWRNVLLLSFLHAYSDFTYLRGTSKERSLEEFFEIDLQEYQRTLESTYRMREELGLHPTPSEIVYGSALELPLPPLSVAGIVTSPPYSITLDYVKNDEHLLSYLGLETQSLRQSMVGLRGNGKARLRFYEEDMKKSLQEMYRILKPGGWAAIVLGDVVVGSKRTNFCQQLLQWGAELGFKEAFSIHRPILGGFARLRFEHILLLKK